MRKSRDTENAPAKMADTLVEDTTPTKNSDAPEQTTEFRARVYVYDLNNCALEFGFKPDEKWEVCLATGAQKTAIEKIYFPALSLSSAPETLHEMLQSVKFKLAIKTAIPEEALDIAEIRKQQIQYIVAYNPARLRGN